MVRPLVNLVVTIIVLVVFEHMGWVTVAGSGASGPYDGGHVVDLVIVGALMFELGEVLEVFFFTALVPIGGWLLALLPFYAVLGGFLRLEAAAMLLPKGWFTFSSDIVPIVMMSFVFGGTRWHLSRKKRRLHSMDDELDVREVEQGDLAGSAAPR
jgi:hypothetical protein